MEYVIVFLIVLFMALLFINPVLSFLFFVIILLSLIGALVYASKKQAEAADRKRREEERLRKEADEKKRQEGKKMLEEVARKALYTTINTSKFEITLSELDDSEKYSENLSEPISVSSIEAVKISLTHIPEIRKFNTCVLIDTETTGLSRSSDRVIEVGIATMEKWEITDTFNSLINPGQHIPKMVSEINGIYDSDAENAPMFGDVAKEIQSRISEKVVAGYNVSFDLSFLGHEMNRENLSAKVYYLDVLSLARRAYPYLNNHKLETVAKHLNLITPGDMQKHRALDDAILTGKVLNLCVNKLLADHDEELRIARERRKEAAELRRKKYEWSPLLEKNFVFTGIFQSNRDQLEKMLDDVGATLRQQVNSNTDFLVVGDISTLPDWAVERKSGKADSLIALGKKVKKISEVEYIAMISEAKMQKNV